MDNIQTDTQCGPIVRQAADSSLVGKIGYLARLTAAGAVLATDVATRAPYVVISDGDSAAGSDADKSVTLEPLNPGKNIRILCTVGNASVPGTPLYQTDTGTVSDAQAADAKLVGFAEEAADASGQAVLVRPMW